MSIPYPKRLYVVQEGMGDDEFLQILEGPSDVDLSECSEREVMIYERVGKCRVEKNVIMEDKK